jgi:hypothetical protein
VLTWWGGVMWSCEGGVTFVGKSSRSVSQVWKTEYAQVYVRGIHRPVSIVKKWSMALLNRSNMVNPSILVYQPQIYLSNHDMSLLPIQAPTL